MKNNNLRAYFPTIRTKVQILEDIRTDEKLSNIFNKWRKDQQELFLDICSGTKGAKMLYDSYFKEILNPEYTPDRLSRLLSILIGKKVTVRQVLTNDNSRLGDELSLVITDIVVELEDGTIANIEVQKIGYAFTGERASCYSADLLLRQYKRLRDSMKEKFSYKEICPVYTIVFLEKSPEEFWKHENEFIHTFTYVSDTGLCLNMLQNYIFIPIDIFLKKLHNDGINNELDAWLAFLGCDEPEYIIELIEKYPYFKPLYADLYEMCLNIEEVLNMFSKELQLLDQNTVIYMIDELEAKIADKDAALASKNAALASKDAEINDLKAKIKELEEQNKK